MSSGVKVFDLRALFSCILSWLLQKNNNNKSPALNIILAERN